MLLVELFLAAALAAPAGPKASSELVGSDKVKHPASHAFDGLLGTWWAEGVQGDGAGQWVELRFDRPTDISSVSIFPGFLAGSDREVREYGRPKLVTLSFEVPGKPAVTKQERLLDPGEEGPLRHDVFLSVPGATAVRITVDEAFGGGLYSDTAISEVAINFMGGAAPPGVQQVKDWLSTPDGLEAANAHRDTAIQTFQGIEAAEFGDRESFAKLTDWAADGAPYLKEKVAKLPWGFRLHALQPDKTSVEALLKLKDSNGIPAIERAALRVTGALAEDLNRRARMFGAYQELLGAKARNISAWGQPGLAKGALKSLGEPLAVATDAWGFLYVADTGNHRVQRFATETGVVDQVWGSPEPDVAEVWFDGKREAYAAGAAPGEESGQFTNPAGLAVAPGKSGDTVFVIDALGRLTEIGPEGRVERVVKVPGPVPVGEGQAHVVTDGSRVVAILGDKGFVYDAKALEEAPATFTLEDGAPSGALLWGGKLALRFEQRLVQYSLDGFRFGDLLGNTLGEGFESWDATLDERGKLWVVLDTGDVVKFRKPGKVDFRVRVGAYSLENPRIAVRDSMAYIVERDKILHVDVLAALEKGSGSTGAGNLELGEEP